MEQIKDILTITDIKQLVDTFYRKVLKDDLLGPVFKERIGDRWPQHIEKMYTFWETVLLDNRTYFGSPFPPHAQLPVNHSHFQKWMEYFVETIDSVFQGQKAEEAKWRAGKMAELFESKIEYFNKHGFKSIL
jgi:hemoglobin